MKKITSLIIFLLISFSQLTAQDADEIIAKYIEYTGGQKQWDNVSSFHVTGTAKLIAQGMELPFDRVMDKDGRQKTTLLINGMEYVAIASDGNEVWGSNSSMQLTLKGEDESKNTKRLINDFPFPGYRWRERGYKVEFVEKTTADSKETYKVKMTKLPTWVDGKEVENVLFIYFDVKTYVPILTESIAVSGPNTGQLMQTYMADYRKVDGLSYPFLVTMKADGQTFQILESKELKWNAEIDETIYKFPKN